MNCLPTTLHARGFCPFGAAGRRWEIAVRVEIGAVGIRRNESIGFVDNLELTVFHDFADVNRFERVLVVGVHLFLAARGVKLQAVDGFTHLVDIKGHRFFNRRLPNVNAKVSGFNGVVSYAALNRRAGSLSRKTP